MNECTYCGESIDSEAWPIVDGAGDAARETRYFCSEECHWEWREASDPRPSVPAG